MTARLPQLHRRALRLGVAALAATLPLATLAGDLSTVDRLTQTQFRLMSEDLGAALSFKPLVPAEPLGTTGFDLGVATAVTIAGANGAVLTLLSTLSTAGTVTGTPGSAITVTAVACPPS